MQRLVFLLISIVFTASVPVAALAQGRIVVVTLHSRALQSNRIGDTPNRAITVYLPPSYGRDTAKRYPVVYLLHGFTSDPQEWLDGTYQGLNLRFAADSLAGVGLTEFIVVMPHADNAFGGSFYVNSAAFGHWEEFVARELVAFIDARYRTLPTRQSRGLAGQSMGGFGALYLAGRHPDVFGHVYAASPCCLAFVGDLAPTSEVWRAAPTRWRRAMAAAFTPAPPSEQVITSAEVPFAVGTDGQLHQVDAVEQAWREYLPLYRLARDPAPYRRLCSIALDAGRQDEIPNVTLGAQGFADELARAGIPHTFELFTGGHVDRTRERFTRAMLPFFAHALATQAGKGNCP